MSARTWLPFALTEVALCLSPGPAVLLVVSRALALGTRASIWSNLGILAGNAMYFALTAAGLGVVLLASHELFTIVKWTGAAYLIWLGIAALRGRGRHAPAAVPAPGRAFASGFVLQAANPKALVFFAALLPQFIDPTGPIGAQVALLGITSMVIEFLVLLGYGLLAARMGMLSARPRFARLADRVAGALLIAAGVTTAAIRKA